MSTQWQIQGDYLESCTCKGACPCIYLEPPTEGDCSALVGWHIKKGAYGEVALDDLNIALALNGSSYEADVKAIEGQNGRKVTIDNHPLAVAPGHSLVVAKSRSLRHRNHGIDLDMSERTALYSPFEYAGP